MGYNGNHEHQHRPMNFLLFFLLILLLFGIED
ncbi:hypothetical protein HDG70_001374 [Carboxydothermus ferrireducens DSM 11255]|uniref:Uncharacterized protein n=1 Tax=Carboxydothermus ferrireducens DSM 11255 TaxID=1119529 RepID=A0ABX2R915_9THEO|nr:hypothetical protein [Carboxydothermus ferrireducens DSM 11255]